MFKPKLLIVVNRTLAKTYKNIEYEEYITEINRKYFEFAKLITTIIST